VDLEVLNDADAVAKRGAGLIAAAAREAIATRGRFLAAFSGGRAPWVMLRELAKQHLPWDQIHIFQIDERVAPDGDPERNLTHLRETLLNHAPIPAQNVHPMPVEEADLEGAAAQYALTLQKIGGIPPVLDLAHLGMGPDGHTASLIPGDPVLDVTDRDVADTGVYQGRRRLTLTYPMLNRSRHILWLITGADKEPMLKRILSRDLSIPAGRVHQEQAIVLTDKAAAGS